jgi:ABC-2 type transport system ATP-binding protein
MNLDPATTPALQTEALTKVFRDFWRRPKVRAVDGLTLSVARGEVFGLLGPNGSGKSTTIKMLLGLLHPTSGSARILGRSPDDLAARRRIGYLPEESHLYRHLTARETLDFYARLFSLPAAERRRRCDQLLDMAGLARAADRPVGEFSKGMARRIGLAQALINDPDLVILDEPTAGLDPVGCRQVKDLMLALAQRGKTVLLCTHLLADVEDVCDRIAILYNGRLRACGRIDEVLRRRDGGEPGAEPARMSLEAFFLNVVREADGRDEAPSGSETGHPLAPFLSGTRSGAHDNGPDA